MTKALMTGPTDEDMASMMLRRLENGCRSQHDRPYAQKKWGMGVVWVGLQAKERMKEMEGERKGGGGGGGERETEQM